MGRTHAQSRRAPAGRPDLGAVSRFDEAQHPIGAYSLNWGRRSINMQEQHITLADIRREAALLEFNVDISSGHLDIYHRADKTTGFWSIAPFDDPRVLAGAWEFLQRQRAYLDQLDEARREMANHPPLRPRSLRATLY